MEAINFDTLAKTAYYDKEGKVLGLEILKNEEHQQHFDALWSNLFKLEQWHIIALPKAVHPPEPFFASFKEDDAWVFVFTDAERVKAFATQHKLLDEEGKCRFVSMKAENAIKWILGLGEQGLSGATFNQGGVAWSSPCVNLQNIAEHLKNIEAI